MNFEFSSEEREMLVYSFDYETREFTGEHMAHIAPYTGIPGNSTLVEPPEPQDGKAIVFNIETGEWEYITDMRGEIVWNKQTRKPVSVDLIGDVSDKFTTEKPATDFDVWDGYSWVKDEDQEKEFRIREAQERKEIMINFAESRIAILSRSVRLGIATDEEKELLEKWEIYTVLLNRVKSSDAPNIIYPESPE